VWVAGWILIHATLFGLGTWILESLSRALPAMTIAVVAAAFLTWRLQRRGWQTVVR